MRKIVRRLNKIDHLPISSASESINQWVENTKNGIQDSINRIFPKSDWQQAVRMNEIRNEDLSMENFHLNNTRICKHLCRDLKAYLDGSAVQEALETGVDTNGHYGDSSQNTKNVDYIPSLEKICVDTHLKQWINHGELAGQYQNAALTHYGSTDPVGYSRFILTSLTIIRFMHHKLCEDNILKRLNAHSIRIFGVTKSKRYDIKHVNAFGVYYAAEIDKQNKIQEVQQAKQRYTHLMDSIRGLSCACTYSYGYRTKFQRDSALAVIFEPQMPSEIRCYRELFWQFLNRPKLNPSSMIHRWLNASPHGTKLSPYYHGPEKWLAQQPLKVFLFENRLEVRISPTQPIEIEKEHRMLTPQLNHSDYKQLQFAIDSTGFIENDVIAKLSDCSLEIQSKEFVEFGSF
ncbi:unnamed protein product [Adineta ricciae]|uniref:Uncharacterized protein n=1 Tax=Adineta ricciae TaxID=249248 RepID=A0A815U161_ADIRI|nr:unnamed protein product [Adineta ricciae]CAF1569349.1 unnamed protein product [Adineta ricciae]